MRTTTNNLWHNVFTCFKCEEVIFDFCPVYIGNNIYYYWKNPFGYCDYDKYNDPKMVFSKYDYNCPGCGEEEPKLIKRIARGKSGNSLRSVFFHSHYFIQCFVIELPFEFREETNVKQISMKNAVPGLLSIPIKDEISDVISFLEYNNEHDLAEKLLTVKNKLD